MGIEPRPRSVWANIAELDRWLREARDIGLNGTYTGTLSGFDSTVTGEVYWARAGDLVVLYIPVMSGTSNATTMTLSAGPENIWPLRSHRSIVAVQDNGTTQAGTASVGTDGVITYASTVAGGAFTASGTKGVDVQTLVYQLR